MDTKEITSNEALSAINVLVMSFIEGGTIDEEALSTTEYAVNLNLQFRDYLMGMPYDYGTNHMINLANVILLRDCSPEFAVALNTILASWLYESGDTDGALKALDVAKGLDSNYPLADLLSRVFNAGWDKESFKDMRDALHLKVLANIKKSADMVISEKTPRQK